MPAANPSGASRLSICCLRKWMSSNWHTRSDLVCNILKCKKVQLHLKSFAPPRLL